jgi:8-oxo-dGTP pyrophosphatase MutT (NUDIX family)
MILEHINNLVNYRQRVEVVIFKEQNILLTLIPPFGNLKSPYHGFPGGGVENETNISAVNREVLEEVGIKINNINKIGISPFKLEISDEIRKLKNITSLGTITNYYKANYLSSDNSLYNKDGDAVKYIFTTINDAINLINEDIKFFPTDEGKKILQYRLKVLHYLGKNTK